VIDTLGRVVEYAYDEEDRIIQIADFTGRLVDFTYDGRGDLISVTSPSVVGTPNGNDFPIGRIVRYEYSSGSSDLRLDHNWIFKDWTLDVYADVQNVYNAQNIETYFNDYRCREEVPVPGIPVLPVLGVKGTF